MNELDKILDAVIRNYNLKSHTGKFMGKTEATQAIQQLIDRAKKESKIGLFYADGSEIKLGDTVDVPYITPMGDLTDDIDEDKRARVVFDKGLYGLKYPFHITPLRNYCNKIKGPYEPNYGEPIIYSDSTILVKVLPAQSLSNDRRDDGAS